MFKIIKECPLCGQPSPSGIHKNCIDYEHMLADVNYDDIMPPHDYLSGGETMPISRNGTYIFVTWLSRLMAGETQCQWGVWFKSHYRYQKMPPDPKLVKWLIDHTKQLNELIDELKPQINTYYKEKQNDFKTIRKQATIAGIPDLITLGKDGNYTIYDVKTGQPKQSDIIQVMLYMTCLPYSRSIIYKGKKLAGCVSYTSYKTPILPEAIDDTFNKQLGHFLDIIDNTNPPAKTPSFLECNYCEITKQDCPERIESEETSTGQDELPV
ncbi:MAG: PD-(D/E)XK nuclease family protein [Dehalococcoidales bacterium]